MLIQSHVAPPPNHVDDWAWNWLSYFEHVAQSFVNHTLTACHIKYKCMVNISNQIRHIYLIRAPTSFINHKYIHLGCRWITYIAHPHILVQATSERFLLAGATFSPCSASESRATGCNRCWYSAFTGGPHQYVWVGCYLPWRLRTKNTGFSSCVLSHMIRNPLSLHSHYVFVMDDSCNWMHERMNEWIACGTL